MPDRGYPMDGWRSVNRYRLRTTWFGFVVAEQLWESRDGSKQWRRAPVWHTVEISVAQ